MAHQTHSIQSRLTKWLTGAIIILFGLSAAGTFFFVRQALVGQVDHHLERLAEDFIAETHIDSRGGVDSGYHELGLEDYQSTDHATVAYYELWDNNGTPLYKSPSLNESDLPYMPVGDQFRTQSLILPNQKSGRAIFVTFEPSSEKKSHWRYRHHSEHEASDKVPVRSSEKSSIEKTPAYPVHLVMAESTTKLSNILWILGTTLAVTAMALAGVTFLLVGILVRKACEPIVELGKITNAIGPDQMNVRLPIERAPSEIQPLIEQFNELVERFEGGIVRERRFSIDVAHELRTPLAELQVLMDVGNQSKFPDFETGSIEDPRVIYETGRSITRRLRKLVETLTAVYHGSSDGSGPDRQPVDISNILNDSIESFPTDIQKRFSYTSRKSNIESDPELLRAVVDNLLSNSASHSPAGSPINITHCDHGVVIENECEGLMPEDLQKIDEPFWKKDEARSDADHFGLGLAIVSVYLQVLGGKIDRELKGDSLRTTITF